MVPLVAVCLQVRRLEELADRKLNSSPEDPPMRAKIDTAQLSQLAADRSAGMTLQQLAQKYGVCQCTAGYWIRKLNGQVPAPRTPPAADSEPLKTNGRADPPPTILKHSSEVDQLLLEHWSRLPLLRTPQTPPRSRLNRAVRYRRHGTVKPFLRRSR